MRFARGGGWGSTTTSGRLAMRSCSSRRLSLVVSAGAVSDTGGYGSCTGRSAAIGSPSYSGSCRMAVTSV
jgi:hypothetical protein